MDSVLKVAGGAVISAVVMGVAWWSSTQTEKQNEDLNPDAKKDKVAILQTELLRMRKEVEGKNFVTRSAQTRQICTES